MNIDEDEKKIKFNKKKNLFKCVSTIKKMGNIFIVKKIILTIIIQIHFLL